MIIFFKIESACKRSTGDTLNSGNYRTKDTALVFSGREKKKRERLREREKKGYICYNHGEEIRTVPTASFPTFFVTKNKPLLFLQQSPSYYLAIQRKKHTTISIKIPV